MVSSTCHSSRGPPLYDHGYISSPNYPAQYHRDASCFWQLSVQKRQAIRVTIFDFELDVNKRGSCLDYVEIATEDRSYFKECGAQGRQQIDIDSTDAVVTFHTDLGSLTDRGFLMYFEGILPSYPSYVLALFKQCL